MTWVYRYLLTQIWSEDYAFGGDRSRRGRGSSGPRPVARAVARRVAQPGQAHRRVQSAAHHAGAGRTRSPRRSSAGWWTPRSGLPIPVTLGGLLIFGARRFVLARLVVPSAGLLDLQAAGGPGLGRAARSAPHLRSGPLDAARDPGPPTDGGPGRHRADRARRGRRRSPVSWSGRAGGTSPPNRKPGSAEPCRPTAARVRRSRRTPILDREMTRNPSAGRGGSGSAAGRRHRGGRAAPPRTAAQRPAHLR